MAWTAPITFYDGDPLTAAQLNTFIRDNLNATAPGIAAVGGRLIVSRGRNVVNDAQWAYAYAGPTITLSSEWPAEAEEEDDQGPSVRFEHGGTYLLLYDCRMRRISGSGSMNYAPEITSGPGELPNVYNMAARTAKSTYIRTGSHTLVTGVEPGVTTVTMKYGVTGAASSGDFAQRRLTAVPL